VSVAITADGARLAYDVRGRGEPLLLISPLAGSIELWGRFRDELAAHATVVAYDHRGLGASSRVGLGVTTRALARDALAVLDHAGIARADVFGLSLGGMVATWLAAEVPTRVRRLVLGSTIARGVALVGSGRALRRGAKLVSCMVRGDAGRCLGEGVLSDRFQAAHPDEAAELERMIGEVPRSRRSLAALGSAAVRHDARALLPRIAAPTLVLCGAHDPLISVARQRRELAALPDVRFDVVADAGHALDLEAPRATAARILAFLREPRGSG
jgi:3-oxoadipate enol-lactonase